MLNCWVHSEDPQAIFQVKISNTNTVYDLQKGDQELDTARCGRKSSRLYKPKALGSIPYEKLGKLILSEHGSYCTDYIGYQTFSLNRL
jgi:Crinkler effector protein N-terminal domain